MASKQDVKEVLKRFWIETPSLKDAKAGMEKKEINAKWQADMAPFFDSLDGKRPDEGFLQLEEVFYLK